MRRAGLSVVVACVVAFACGAGVAQDEPPMNVVLFLVDDLGWQDVATPMLGEPTAQNHRWRTPNVDRLAARGVRFTNGYASAPVCTPTRTSILTGKSPGRTGITYWTLRKDVDTSRNRDDLSPPAWELNGLQPGDHALLPELMRGAGYRTIHAGKAHFGTIGTDGADPTKLGFDVNIAGHAAGAPASYFGEHHFSQAGKKGEDHEAAPAVWDVPGLEKYHDQDIYLTEALAIEVSGAVRDAVADEMPFYLHFAPYAVHTPVMANERYTDNYPDLDAQETKYATMIESVDAALGELVRTLEETGQLDNTVIIFTGDNGGLSAHARGAAPDGETRHTHNAPAKSGKGSAYEGGTRVPWVIAWPGETDPGGVFGRAGAIEYTPIVSQDIFPTFLSIAGVELPTPSELDGVDLRRAVRGFQAHAGVPPVRPRVIGWHQPHQWGASGPGIEPYTAVRRGKWKLIYFHAGERFELYDLEADVGETTDLSGSEHPKLVSMVLAMEGWLNRTGARLSVVKATGESVRRPIVVLEEREARAREAKRGVSGGG